MADKATENKGLDVYDLLLVLLIGLRLTGHITWPWLLVVAPIWIPFAMDLAIGLFGVAIAAIASFRKKK